MSAQISSPKSIAKVILSLFQMSEYVSHLILIFTLEAESSQSCPHHPFPFSDHCLAQWLRPSVKTCGRERGLQVSQASMFQCPVITPLSTTEVTTAHLHICTQSPMSVSAEPAPCVREWEFPPAVALRLLIPTEILDTIPTEDHDVGSSVWQVNPEECTLFSSTLDKGTFEFTPCFLI